MHGMSCLGVKNQRRNRLVNRTVAATSLPQAPEGFVALAFILRKMRATMVNARFSSRRNVALIRPD
jgi:hypothetical protein